MQRTGDMGLFYPEVNQDGEAQHNAVDAEGAEGVAADVGHQGLDDHQADDEAFRLIMNALLIAKYGTAVFNLKGEIFHEP